MRTIRILACLGAVFALGAITAASASASPEFDAAVYPTTGVEQKATQLNIQGFNGGGVVIACRKFTANTNEEIGKVGTGKEATNPKKKLPDIDSSSEVHRMPGDPGRGQLSRRSQN